MSEVSLAPLTSADGDNLAVQDWALPSGVKPRGTVLIVHGLGEHAGRYHHVALRLNAWGYHVRGYDHYGHGDSGGVRGALPDDYKLLDDLADVVDNTRARMAQAGQTQPLILLGHSMGGLVALQFVLRGLRLVDALVLTSPALDAGLSTFQKLLLAALPKIAPNLRVGNGLKPQFISHDPAVVGRYKADPLVHDRISARLANWIYTQGQEALANGAMLQTPTLLMYAGQDKLVNPQGSADFAQAVAAHATANQHLQTHCFAHMYHEILNEPDADLVFEHLGQWLAQRVI
jgi:alpha-beta hydrolase superfamily lysophospholipase